MVGVALLRGRRRLWHWAGSGDAIGSGGRRGRRGTLHEAWRLVTSTVILRGLADIGLRFAWQARHFWHWAGSGDALGSGGRRGRRGSLRGKRGT